MIRSYLTSAIRNVLRQRMYGVVNISGLAIGLAASLALSLWVLDEIGYDEFHDNADQIQRVCRSRIRNGQLQSDGVSAAPLGPTLKERFPGVAEYCRVSENRTTLSYADKSYQGSALYVDPTFIDIFSFEIERGNRENVLEAPNSIVLTQEAAIGLFGAENPIGQKLDNGLVVTGIVARAPDNSSLQYDFLVANEYLVQTGAIIPDEWFSFQLQTFILLENRADADALGASFKDLYREIDAEANIELQLQPLLDIHLKPVGGGGRIVYVYTFSLVAFLLLVVACINFVNLATARATQRAKEIGIRKVVGATRWQLSFQVMLEMILQTALAMLLAVSLLEFALPMLTDFFGKPMVLSFSLETIMILSGVCLATGLAAGVYPALVLSSFRPAISLRITGSNSRRGPVGAIRKALVVFQFAVSSGLIFGALVINAQMNYIQSKDLGINHDNVVCVSTDRLQGDYEAFEGELMAQPGIELVSAVFDPPAWCGYGVTGFDFDGQGDEDVLSSGIAWVDYNYVDLFGLEIVEGRNLSEEYGSDATDACLINETAARAMKMEQPIGLSLDWEDGHQRTIVGVVKDFHFASLHSEVDPLIMAVDPSWFRRLCVRLDSDNVAAGLGSVERVFGEFRPGEDFEVRFLDDLLSREYRLEARTKGIAIAFTVITTIVAILGLLGLAAISIERRTKEIGIRKALGSSKTGIIRLVTKEFMILILIGNVIVAPVAYYLISRWLENFAYRVEPGGGWFLLTALITVLGTMLTISFKAIQAARANPIDALKYE